MAGPFCRLRIGSTCVCAAIGVAGALIVLALRYTGHLQSAELYAYDTFIRSRAPIPSPKSDQIAIVEMNERDIEKYDHPLQDTELAELLEKVESAKPAVVGLDLYRDLPEPRHNRGSLEKLTAVLKNYDNIICAFEFGTPEHPFGIPPPEILKTRVDDRIGFNDFCLDNNTARRALIYLSDAKRTSYTSFAMLLAFVGGGLNPEDAGNGLVGLGGAPVYKFTANTGGYINGNDGGYQFLLDFKGPQTFATYTLDEVFGNKLPANALAGKIVLIGEANASVKDAIATPLNDAEPGVELHATVVDQLIRMQFHGARVMRAWGAPAQTAWLFFWCMTAAGIGYTCRAPIAFTAAPVGMVILLLGCSWGAFKRDWWIPLVPPLAGSLPVTALAVSYMGYREKMDRATLMNIFSRHVSKGVAETVWEQRDLFTRDKHMIPLRLTATVLFTDLQDFSTVAETMEPEELLAWINEYMELLVRHVEDYGGMVNKYMGDSIMAVFGAPVPRNSQAEIERDAINSVKCAIAMGEALIQLNIARRAQNRAVTNMRVGIYTGPAVSGSIGSCERLEFTVLGDTVNTASRLESFDKSIHADQTCRILLGDSTRELVDSNFHLEYVKTIELKGQHEQTGIYYVPLDKNTEAGAKSGPGTTGEASALDGGLGNAALAGALSRPGERSGGNPDASVDL